MTKEQIDEWINRTSEWTEQVGTAVPVDVVRQIIAAASAESDRDAARYRWLRGEGFDRPAHMWVTRLPEGTPIVHSDLDTAIDAAIEQEKAAPTE